MYELDIDRLASLSKKYIYVIDSSIACPFEFNMLDVPLPRSG